MNQWNFRTRVRMSDHLTRANEGKGLDIPAEFRHAAPEVIWQTEVCSRRRRHCRLLRAFRGRDCWYVIGESFRVTTAEGLIRRGGEYDVEDVQAGRVAAIDIHKVRGREVELSLDIDTWDSASAAIEVGCDHGHDLRPLTDLASDCRAALVAAPVIRPVTWTRSS